MSFRGINNFFRHSLYFNGVNEAFLRIGVTVVLIAGSMATANVWAEDKTNPTEYYRLGDILVTDQASPNSPTGGTDIGTSYTLTREDFDRSDARTLDQALTALPSINVRNGGDGTPRLDIRGLRTRQIKLLVNGIPFNSADDGQFDPTLIPTFAIGRIRLQAGASSVLYGDGGMGGVLDIQTRGGFKGIQSGAKVEIGSSHFWNTNAYVGGGDGTNEFFIAAGVMAKDGFPLSDDFDSTIASSRPNFENGGTRNNSDTRRVNFVTSFNRQVTDALNMGIFLSHVEGYLGKPPSVFNCRGNSLTCLTTGDPFATTTKFERTEEQRGTSIQIGADYDPGGNWSGRLWFYANALEEDLAGYDNASYNTLIRRNSYQEEDRTNIRGFHAQLNRKIDVTGANLGFVVDRREESLDANGISCDNANNNAAQNQTCVISGGQMTAQNGPNRKFNYSPIAVNKDISVTSYAAELNQPLPYDINLVVGAAHHVLDKDGGNDTSANSAQLGLSKKLTDITNIYGTLARKVDTPTIQQLYDPPKGTVPSGNQNLDFERANHLEFGVKNHWARSSLDIAVYQSRVYGFIDKDDTLGYINHQLLVFRGVDVTGSMQATDALTLRAALGLLDAKDKSDDAVSETLQYRPKNKFTLDADYIFLGNWSLTGRYQHVGSQAYFSKLVVSDHRNLDSYDLVSTQLRYRLSKDLGAFYVGADNLLDKDYSTSYGFPQQGRFLYTGLELKW